MKGTSGCSDWFIANWNLIHLFTNVKFGPVSQYNAAMSGPSWLHDLRSRYAEGVQVALMLVQNDLFQNGRRLLPPSTSAWHWARLAALVGHSYTLVNKLNWKLYESNWKDWNYDWKATNLNATPNISGTTRIMTLLLSFLVYTHM